MHCMQLVGGVVLEGGDVCSSCTTAGGDSCYSWRGILALQLGGGDVCSSCATGGVGGMYVVLALLGEWGGCM